jgi:two-component system, sensor histidine kinase and response regulator
MSAPPSALPTILGIDDDPGVLTVIRDSLEAEGFRVILAEGGTQGIHAARTHLPDVVVCDVGMPQVDGHGVLAALRANSSTAAVPLIFLTAEATRAGQRRGMEAGADDYVTKPFTTRDLVLAVRTQIQKHESTRRRSEETLEDLRSSITLLLPHELLTPLSPIVGYADVLRSYSEHLKPADLVQMGEDLDRSAKRLERMVRNILFYAKLEILGRDRAAPAGSARTDSIVAPVKAGVEKAIARHSRPLDLRITVEDLPAAIATEHLEIIAEELADNACKFSAPGTAIDVRAEPAGNRVRLSVIDHGRGMSREEIKKLGAYLQFQRKLFEQQGAGLGLIIVKSVAELAGGQFSLTSMPGGTTIAEVYIPMGYG